MLMSLNVDRLKSFFQTKKISKQLSNKPCVHVLVFSNFSQILKGSQKGLRPVPQTFSTISPVHIRRHIKNGATVAANNDI